MWGLSSLGDMPRAGPTGRCGLDQILNRAFGAFVRAEVERFPHGLTRVEGLRKRQIARQGVKYVLPGVEAGLRISADAPAMRARTKSGTIRSFAMSAPPITLPARADPAFWRGKRVLLTGHTRFKGSWLMLWLKQMGA